MDLFRRSLLWSRGIQILSLGLPLLHVTPTSTNGKDFSLGLPLFRVNPTSSNEKVFRQTLVSIKLVHYRTNGSVPVQNVC
jgi:hypothetical protein